VNTKELIKAAHQNAVTKGFYTCPECKGVKVYPPCNHTGCYNHISHPCEGCGRIVGKCPTCDGASEYADIGTLLMRIVTEISKAVEAHRKNRFALWDLYSRSVEIQEFPPFEEKAAFSHYIKDTFEDKIAGTFIKLFELYGYLWVDRDIIEIDEPRELRIANNKNIPGFLYECLTVLPRVYQMYVEDEFIDSISYFYSVMLYFCTDNKIDIQKHITAKMAYNLTRPPQARRGVLNDNI